jgi:hypothetical protein
MFGVAFRKINEIIPVSIFLFAAHHSLLAKNIKKNKKNYETYHFVLMVYADSVFDERLDDVEVSLRGRPLKRGVPGLKRERKWVRTSVCVFL